MAKLHEISALSTCYRIPLSLVTRCVGGLQCADAIAVVVLMQGPLPSFAQDAAEACVSPEPPYTALPLEDLRAYRTELSYDFESYFSAITQYIQCLDAERARVMRESAEIATLYENFLEATTNDENK